MFQITFLSKTGGTSREGDGGKVAYKVIDQMFDPAVLTNYTWTGIARGKNSTKKMPFQILEGILDVFFQVISLADSRHTMQKNCNIFKEGVLKHATKRSLRKRYCTIDEQICSLLFMIILQFDEIWLLYGK